jgi:uncharacterized protein YdeI (YjbR/CyaY-like superfamily)
MTKPRSVDEYIASAPYWQDELRQLRRILRSTPLEETVKWGAPCYTYAGKNIVGLGAFKSYVGLWFHQGALLSDPEGVLISAQAGRTRALRQWRFGSKRDIKVRAVRAYVNEAIELQRQGRAIKPDRSRPVVVPADLKAALAKSKRASAAFERLTKGRRREYADYVGEAKRQATRRDRVKKVIPMIVAGKGLNDRHRN